MCALTNEQRARGRATMANQRKMKNREEQAKQAILDARDRGLSIEEVAKECKTSIKVVKKTIYNGVHKAERIQRFNEALVARSAKGIAVVDQWLDKGDKDVAMWLLKETGAVGKEQVNVTINANNAQVNLSNDTIEAAREVAQLMRATVRKQLPPSTDVIDAELIQQETNDEHTGDNVGRSDQADNQNVGGDEEGSSL